MNEHQEFSQLWSKAQSTVKAFVTALVPDYHQAEDITQDIAFVLMKKFAKYDKKRSFIAWALGIARLEVLSSKRKYLRSFLIYHDDILDKFEQKFEESFENTEDRKRALILCLKEIKGAQKEIVILKYSKGMRLNNISKSIGVSINAAKTMLHRVRNKLRLCIERRMKI